MHLLGNKHSYSIYVLCSKRSSNHLAEAMKPPNFLRKLPDLNFVRDNVYVFVSCLWFTSESSRMLLDSALNYATKTFQ
jgi:hypothetical protein